MAYANLGNTRQLKLMAHSYEFDVTHKLGQGAFGTVYRATDIMSNKTVALKRVRCEELKDEIKIMYAVGRHDHIIELYDSNREGRYLWMALEYCNLGDLESFCIDRTKPDIDLIVSILRQCALGLQLLHTNPRPIVYRDLKLSNVLLKRNSDGSITAKLADFGLSRIGEHGVSISLWQLSTLTGTPLYMAPEFWVNGNLRYTVAVDIFALGLMLEVLVHYSQEIITELYPGMVYQPPRLDMKPIGELMQEEGKTCEVVKFVEGESEKHRHCKELVKEMTQYDPENRPRVAVVISTLDEMIGMTQDI